MFMITTKLLILLSILLCFSSSSSSSRIGPTFIHDYASNYAWLAAVGYCTPAQIASNNCCQKHLKETSWEIFYTEKIIIDDISASILVNDKIEQIVVTFSGTRSKFQLLKEFYASLHEFVPIREENKEIKLMSYFKSVYDQFAIKNKNILIEKLKALANVKKHYQYVFLGHSLGGAMASIFSREFAFINRSEDSPVLLSYASPRTGNFAFANSVMINVPIVFRIAMEEDPVPMFPFCHSVSEMCTNFFNTVKFIEELNFNDQNSKDTYPWHTGGLVIYKDDFKTFVDCGKSYGENNEENTYCSKFSIYKNSIEDLWKDIEGATLHGFYFINIKMSAYCVDNISQSPPFITVKKLLK